MLGALAVVFGVGLMATAGYLISRAAERPPILSLTVAIVAVRFFGLARPLARYLERLASHDLALRSLGRVRARFYERIEPLAPAQLEGYRRGDLLDRMVGDVDALQGLYLRALGPPLVAVAGRRRLRRRRPPRSCPRRRSSSPSGCSSPASRVPAASPARLGRAAGRRQAAARARADRRARRAAARRTRARRLRPRGGAPRALRRADGELVALGRRDALAAGLGGRALAPRRRR